MLTFLPLEEIAELEKLEGSELNRAKEILAFETTKMVHGEEEAKKAQESARALFGGGASMENVPTVELDSSELADGALNILDLLVKAGLAPSKSEARRNVTQGGVSVDGEKVTDAAALISLDKADGVMVRRGKKAYKKVIVK